MSRRSNNAQTWEVYGVSMVPQTSRARLQVCYFAPSIGTDSMLTFSSGTKFQVSKYMVSLSQSSYA
jgi:hypothetical protein